MFEILQYPFMRQALICGGLIATLCALLSPHIHYKNQSLMSDGISHAILFGITLAALTGTPLILGAFASALLCAALTHLINKHTVLKNDTALGISYTTLFATGLLIYHHYNHGEHLTHILFGNLLGIPDSAQQRIILTAFILIPPLLAFRRPLTLSLYDPIQARLSGIPVRLIDALMLAALAFTAVAAIEAVGIILTVALFISPALTARLITRRYPTMQLIAVLSAWTATITGIYLSFYFDTATGANIVLCQTLLFISALAASRTRRPKN